MSDVNSDNEPIEEQDWLSDIQDIFEESGLLKSTITLESGKLQDSTVYYIVLNKGKAKERIATIYESPTESYDASVVADIVSVIFDLVPDLVNEIIDTEQVDTVKIEEGHNKLSAVRFMMDRAMEVAESENSTADELKAFIMSIDSILTSNNINVTERLDQDDKVSILHLLPDAARTIFGEQ